MTDIASAEPEPEPDGRETQAGIRSVIGYGAGDFANNLAFALSTAFLLLYYTDVVGLPAAAIGTMFLIVRLWDAFAGRMVDRTMTRWGKFRPFILFGSIPLLVMSVLTFYVPQGWDGGAQLMYAYLTYAVLGLIYSARSPSPSAARWARSPWPSAGTSPNWPPTRSNPNPPSPPSRPPSAWSRPPPRSWPCSPSSPTPHREALPRHRRRERHPQTEVPRTTEHHHRADPPGI